MKFTTPIVLVSMLLCTQGYASVIYDIDYEPPVYTNGQHIGGGQNETVRDDIAGFDSQAVLIESGGGLVYSASESFSAGLHQISWDFGVPVEQSSSEIISMRLRSASVDVTLTGSALSSTYLVEYGPHPLGQPRLSVPFDIGEVYSFQLVLDVSAALYDLYLDDIQLLDDEPLQFGPDTFDQVRFTQGQTVGLQAGLDNFSWIIIPEPSTYLLLLLGGLGSGVRWLRRRRPCSSCR